MGKKINIKVSSRICKNERQQFNSLIKVLRPKVYITDASNFKTLVQELTGNNSSTTLSDLPHHDQSQIITEQQIQREEESSTGMSIDSLNSGNQVVVNEEVNDEWWNQINEEDVTAFDSSMDLEAVESWLFDMDTCRFDDSNGFAQIEQETTSYDMWLNSNLPDQSWRDLI